MTFLKVSEVCILICVRISVLLFSLQTFKDSNSKLSEYSWLKISFVCYVLCILLTLWYVLLFLLCSEEDFCCGTVRSYRQVPQDNNKVL